jgi:hypothetical protein
LIPTTRPYAAGRGFRSAAGLLLLGVLAAGCDRPASTPPGSEQIQPSYDPGTGKLTRLSYDSNNDGKHDTWAFMDGARLIKLEADENQDGRVDRWEYYPAAGDGGVKQPPERIERSTRFDGKVSRREFFEGGVMVKVEEDTDGDDRIDKWETYSGGTLTLLALDTKGLGKPDRRLVYAPDGSLDRIEEDADGSGQFRVAR